MKKSYLILLIIVLAIVSQEVYAQYGNPYQQGGQRRGYIPPPRTDTETSINLMSPYEQVNIILPKCVEAFKLDDFEREIVKGSLLKRFKSQNMILGNKDNSSDDKKKALIEIDKSFYKELALILSADEIEQFKAMDFSETREEKKQKKKKKKKKKKEKQKQKN